MTAAATLVKEAEIRHFSYIDDPASGDECCVTIGQAMAGDDNNHVFCADPGAFYKRWRAIAATILKGDPTERMIYSMGDDHGAVALAYFQEECEDDEEQEDGRDEGAGDKAPPGHGIAPSPEDYADISQNTRPEALPVRDELLAFLGAKSREFYQAHGPFMYVKFLATRPQHQGRGLGSALLRQLTDAADAAGRWCYLEATSEDNMRLYKRHGFHHFETKQWVLPSVPGRQVSLFLMGRPPAPVAQAQQQPLE